MIEDMNLLTLDEMRALPDDRDCAGVYFLWLGDNLQYIGQSMDVGNRVASHQWAYMYGRFRSRPTKQIKFERHTCIALDAGPPIDCGDARAALRDRLVEIERAYIERYPTPFNTELFAAAQQAELARIRGT